MTSPLFCLLLFLFVAGFVYCCVFRGYCCDTGDASDDGETVLLTADRFSQRGHSPENTMRVLCTANPSSPDTDMRSALDT
jgi:hypothetical protein